MARHDLFETEPKVLRLVAFDVKLPIFAAGLSHIDYNIRLARGLKAEIEIVAHCPSVDAHDAITALQLQFGAHASGRDFGNLDAAAPNLGNCRCDCELVHEIFPAGKPESIAKPRCFVDDPGAR